MKVLFKTLLSYLNIFLIFTSPINAKKVIELNTVFKRPILAAVDHRFFYIYDEKNLEINIFSKKNNQCIKKFGRKGEGPGEFKWINYIGVYLDYIFVSSVNKISYFSLDGKLIKEYKTQYATSEYIPLGKNYVCKKYERNLNIVKIFDTNLKEIKSDLESFVVKPNYVPSNNNKINAYVITDFFGYRVSNDKIYIGNTRKGLYFSVFNVDGKKLYEIKRDIKKIPINLKNKKAYMIKLLKSVGKQRFEAAKQKYNYMYPEYFPAFSNFSVENDRIFLLTYIELDNKQQVLILDEAGNIIKRVFIPISKDFTNDFFIYGGNYYYMVDNEKLDQWELHEINIYN